MGGGGAARRKEEGGQGGSGRHWHLQAWEQGGVDILETCARWPPQCLRTRVRSRQTRVTARACAQPAPAWQPETARARRQALDSERTGTDLRLRRREHGGSWRFHQPGRALLVGASLGQTKARTSRTHLIPARNAKDAGWTQHLVSAVGRNVVLQNIGFNFRQVPNKVHPYGIFLEKYRIFLQTLNPNKQTLNPKP
jgi:hypothetical protein